MRAGRRCPPDHLKDARIYSAISFASLSGIVFVSKRLIPGPGFRIFPTMSMAVLTPWASLSFFWSVTPGLMLLPVRFVLLRRVKPGRRNHKAHGYRENGDLPCHFHFPLLRLIEET
jgi:hypothetical protein